MFTGLIEEVGVVRAIEELGDGRAFVIEASKIMDDLSVDDSVSVCGVCLTVTDRTEDTFRVTAVAQTLRKTTLRSKSVGRQVNLERAVTLQDRLGGHLVQGHIDATGIVSNIVDNQQGIEAWIAFPTSYRKWIIPVGSICVHGVSLTIADVQENQFKVALIPHTLAHTTLGVLVYGQEVNLEFDLIAKYVESMMAVRTS